MIALAVPLAATVLVGCLKAKPAAPAPPAVISTPPTGGLQGEVKAYVPCGMIVPLRAVGDKFQADHPTVKVVGTYDNAGILVERLLKKHEQADVLVSPGATEMRHLEQAGLLDSSSEEALGDFELVVMTPRASRLQINSAADLKKCRTIAMPDPQVNSIGTCGQEALTKLGLWEELKGKMVLPKHAIDAYTMVAAGKADAGLAYRNCPLDTNPEKLSKSKVTIAFSFPADSYVKQQCLVALLKAAPNPAAAKAFVAFLTSPAGRKLLADNGMAGSLELKPAPPAQATAARKAAVTVVAFYPASHTAIKTLIESLPAKYPGQVRAEFVDFSTDEGFKRRQQAGLSCGAILINGQPTWTYEKGGRQVQVSFLRALGGEWTEADLHAVIHKLLKENKPK
jgi:molybdate transport system substrate-binding protein